MDVHAATPDRFLFHIAAGPAGETLKEFSLQAPVHISYNADWTIPTRAVEGRFTIRTALKQMLAGTDLTSKFTDPATVAIRLKHKHPVEGDHDAPADGTHRRLEEVMISTGTHISEIQPIGSELQILDQSQIRDSGAISTAELVRKLPQNFGGGPSEDTRLVSAEARANSGLGIGLNLRGLGSRATLVLIDGRRMAPSGNEASFTDVENVPLGAVDRVEILLDGASALYGSDAVGGVVNFITRDHFTGVETFADVGSVTDGSQFQYDLRQLFGKAWDSGNVFVAGELYRRDALSAADRRYTTSNLTPFGGPNFDSLASNPGTITFASPTTGTQTYAIPPHQNGIGLNFQSLIPGTRNLSDLYSDADILPSQYRRSLYAAIHQAMSDGVTAFGTFLVTDRHAVERQGGSRLDAFIPSSNTFLLNRPDTGSLRVQYDLAKDLGPVVNDAEVVTFNLTLGMEIALTDHWRLSTSLGKAVETEHQHTLGQVDPTAVDNTLSTTLNPFGDGSHTDPATLAGLEVEPVFHSRSELWQFNWAVDGPLLNLPGGEVRSAWGMEVRRQRFMTELFPPSIGSTLGRQLTAGFGEVAVPLFGPHNSRAGFQKLDLSVAARFEHYSDFGHTLTPKLGLAWTPFQGLEILSTWGKSTRAPNPGDLDEHSNVSFLAKLPDAASATGDSEVLIVSGKNAHLTAERATSGTFGMNFTPPGLHGLSFSATYFHVVFKDRIQSTDLGATLLTDPLLQAVVIRNPNAEFREQICGNANNHFVISSGDCLHSPIAAIVDLRDRNLATLRTEGIDLCADWGFEGSWGRVSLDFKSTYLLDYSQIAMPNDPRVRLLNTENNRNRVAMDTCSAEK